MGISRKLNALLAELRKEAEDFERFGITHGYERNAGAIAYLLNRRKDKDYSPTGSVDFFGKKVPVTKHVEGGIREIKQYVTQLEYERRKAAR